MSMEDKIVMYDDVVVTQVTTSDEKMPILYKGADGILRGSEDSVRYQNCTHKKCECGGIMKKYYTSCEQCQARHREDRYQKMEYVEWDEKTPVYDGWSDKYFFSADDIEEYLEDTEDGDSIPDALMLILCEPNKYRYLSSDYWEDALAEDGELDSRLEAKIKEINELIDTLPVPSWEPGKKRTSYERADREPTTTSNQ